MYGSTMRAYMLEMMNETQATSKGARTSMALPIMPPTARITCQL